jgi:hypothetical protein
MVPEQSMKRAGYRAVALDCLKPVDTWFRTRRGELFITALRTSKVLTDWKISIEL